MKKIMFLVFMLTLAISGSAFAQADNRLVNEGVVNAPVKVVWDAFTTKAGLESWLAAHTDFELKIGGKMRTQYDPKGTTDDAKAIQSTIMSYDPMRMLSFGVTKAPEAFPYPHAIYNMWTVIYFEASGEKATRVRVVSMGFGDDEESKKMYDFFKVGNAYTLDELKKHFASVARK